MNTAMSMVDPLVLQLCAYKYVSVHAQASLTPSFAYAISTYVSFHDIFITCHTCVSLCSFSRIVLFKLALFRLLELSFLFLICC
jgi:hypothetical protein